MIKRSSSIPRIRSEIPEEVATAFQQALKIRAHREDEIADGKQCKGVGLCEVCDEYERLVAIVDTALDLKAYELSPVDVFDAPPPPMWSAEKQADWDRARVQHVALAKAAGMEPVKKALLTDGCRAHANIRWAERYNKIPEPERRPAVPPVGISARDHPWDLRRSRLLAGDRCRAEEAASRVGSPWRL